MNNMKAFKQSLLMCAAILGCSAAAIAQQNHSPLVSSWKFNTGQRIIHNGDTIITDVTSVYYDSDYVYVKTSDIPSYYNFTNSNGNHNEATDIKATYKFPRKPQKNSGGKQASTLGGGQYGLYRDGTNFYNGEDNNTYNNGGVWHQLAPVFEMVDFDASCGHTSPMGDYHHHKIDYSLVDTTKKTVHSPLIGFAFDGYPVYGPYGYSDSTNMASKIIRMRPSYQKRKITDRTTLPDGSKASQAGPGFGAKTPLGCYREDYEFIQNSGTLDFHNGRFTKTPEYPNGTYAYFATIDSLNQAVYPYILGQSVYGVADMSNMGPNGGKKTTIPSSALKYTAIEENSSSLHLLSLNLYPNPAHDMLKINVALSGNYLVSITDLAGRILHSGTFSGTTADVNVSQLSTGIYLLKISQGSSIGTYRFVKE